MEKPYSYNIRHSWDQSPEASREMANNRTDIVNDGSVEFPVDHLASFSPSNRMTPEEAVNKLRAIEHNTGIWSLPCVLQIDAKSNVVVVRLKHTGEDMERFPLGLVVRPAVVPGSGYRDPYGSLLMFTVEENDAAATNQRAPIDELHVFQLESPGLASRAADVIRQAKATGRASTGSVQVIATAAAQLPAQPRPVKVLPSPDELSAQRFTNDVLRDLERIHTQPEAMDEFRGLATGTTVMDITERQLYLLNRCFDDVEKFVGRLKLASDAYKELVKRRGQGNQRLGDGLLTIRTRLPPTEDFVTALQKIKLSMNLLGQLQGRIHDPNASELVHILFDPLKVVVESTRDPNNPKATLASRVVAPLFTRPTLQLLFNCLNSEEARLMSSLGPAWQTPREEWPDKSVAATSYLPVFWDGYQPNQADFDQTVTSGPVGQKAQYARNGAESAVETPWAKEEQRHHKQQKQQDQQKSKARQDGGSGGGSFDRVDGDSLTKYTAAGARSSMEAGQPRDLNGSGAWSSGAMVAGTGLARGQSWTGHHGSTDDERRRSEFCAEVLSRGGRLYEATGHQVGRNAKELTVQPGDILEMLDNQRNWWRLRSINGQVGYCPYTILKEYSRPGDGQFVVVGTGQLNQGVQVTLLNDPMIRSDHGHYMSDIPDAPPPPPAPPLLTFDPSGAGVYAHVRSHGQRSGDERTQDRRSLQQIQAETLADELKSRMRGSGGLRLASPPVTPVETSPPPAPVVARTPSTHQATSTPVANMNIRGSIRRPHPLITATGAPCTLQQDSNPAQVRQWLMYKNFSDKALAEVGRKTATELFRMTRKQMDTLLGKEEGARLESQLKVQKSLSGFKTMSGRELQAILQHRKELAEIENSNEDQPQSQPDAAGSPTSPNAPQVRPNILSSVF